MKPETKRQLCQGTIYGSTFNLGRYFEAGEVGGMVFGLVCIGVAVYFLSRKGKDDGEVTA